MYYIHLNVTMAGEFSPIACVIEQPIFSQNERCKFLILLIKLYFYDKKSENFETVIIIVL